jgi:hypothetical protein
MSVEIKFVTNSLDEAAFLMAAVQRAAHQARERVAAQAAPATVVAAEASGAESPEPVAPVAAPEPKARKPRQPKASAPASEPVQNPAPTASPAAPAAPVADAPVYTLEQVREHLAKLELEDAIKVVASIGYERVSAVPADKYPALIAAIDAAAA